MRVGMDVEQIVHEDEMGAPLDGESVRCPGELRTLDRNDQR
jgi:hypothetical protein